MKTSLKYACCGVGIFLFSSTTQAQTSNNPQLPQHQKRLEILQASNKGAAAVASLTTALNDPDILIRRAAVRALGEIGKPALPALETAFKTDTDELVRRSAFRALLEIEPDKTNVLLEAGLADANHLVRIAAVEALSGPKPYTARTTALLQKAQQDKHPEVSQFAAQALWPYNKNAASVRERPEFKDHQLNVKETIPIPADGWKFRTDPEQAGHWQSWFEPTFIDSTWSDIAIAKPWGEQSHAYEGIAWYRRTITLPEKPVLDGVDLVFDGVDASAWIWINGRYAGAHDVGAEGVGKKFQVDVTNLINWGQENHLTVRVLGRKQAGGITKPVYFEVVKK